jgi:hypothetical protein
MRSFRPIVVSGIVLAALLSGSLAAPAFAAAVGHSAPSSAPAPSSAANGNGAHQNAGCTYWATAYQAQCPN